MVVKLKYKWIGIAIPTLLISFIGYGSHYFILSRFLSVNKQALFQLSITMIWLSYYLAIYTNPGKPPKDFTPSELEWKNYCKKCEAYKPERAHHCKTCKQCVLMMDHYCPWTMNSVGHANFPHFMRFLIWVVFTTCFLLVELLRRMIYLWGVRHRSYTITSLTEIIALCVFTPMDAFVLISVSALLLRCIHNQILRGMTQIESWEMERIESLHNRRKLIPILIDNLLKLRPELKNTKQEEIKKLCAKRFVDFESIVNFPYDIDLWTNLTTVLGPWYLWLWPFSKPSTDGTSFKKNENSIFEPDSCIEDMLMSLPWPPDGGRHNVSTESLSIEFMSSGGEQAIRNKTVDPRDTLNRNSWYNDWGEDLSDFGVDTEVE